MSVLQSGQLRETWESKEGVDGDQMRGVGGRYLLCLHPTKSQLMLKTSGLMCECVCVRKEGSVISSDSIIWEQTGNRPSCDV